MPSVGISLTIVGAQPGYWILRAYTKLAGRVIYADDAEFSYITMALYARTEPLTLIGSVKPLLSHGYCVWDGTLEGTWTDLLKKGYRVFSYYKRGDLVKETWVDIDLGFAGVNYTANDWDRWVSLVWRNEDAKLPWNTGLPPDVSPYDWWHGMSMIDFIRALEKHIDRADETLWHTWSGKPAGLTLVMAGCPICGANLGFAGDGQDVKCPNCGFVSAWTRGVIKPAWEFKKIETYKL